MHLNALYIELLLHVLQLENSHDFQ